MYDEFFEQSVARLEDIYSLMMNGELDSGDEIELRMEMIDLISTIHAATISEKEQHKEFLKDVEKTRDMIIEWVPTGHWFRYQNELVNLVNSVIVEAKKIALIKSSNQVGETTHLKDELDSLKSELSDLRLLMSELMKEKKPSTKKMDLKETFTSEITVRDEEQIIVEKEEIIEDSFKEEEETIPLILPLEVQDKKDEIGIEEYSASDYLEDSQNDEDLILAEKTVQKLALDRDAKIKVGTVLDQMKSIITQAEKETVKQLELFKQQLNEDGELKSKSIVEKSGDEIPIKTLAEEQKEQLHVKVVDESLVKPSEVIKQQQQIKGSSSAVKDPYMQLLTLEAEKYRLEKAIEKNETDFQEGLKSKIEFDESIQLINRELTIIREKIDSLRNQLTS